METLLGMSEIAPFTNHPFTHSLYLNNSQRRLPCILTELNATIGDVASIKGLIFRVERIQGLDATSHGRLFLNRRICHGDVAGNERTCAIHHSPFTPSPNPNNSQRRLPCILTELNATVGDVASNFYTHSIHKKLH